MPAAPKTPLQALSSAQLRARALRLLEMADAPQARVFVNKFVVWFIGESGL